MNGWSAPAFAAEEQHRADGMAALAVDNTQEPQR